MPPPHTARTTCGTVGLGGEGSYFIVDGSDGGSFVCLFVLNICYRGLNSDCHSVQPALCQLSHLFLSAAALELRSCYIALVSLKLAL